MLIRFSVLITTLNKNLFNDLFNSFCVPLILLFYLVYILLILVLFQVIEGTVKKKKNEMYFYVSACNLKKVLKHKKISISINEQTI